MRKRIWWWSSAAVVLAAGTLWYSCQNPDSLVGCCIRTAADFGSRLNPLPLPSYQVAEATAARGSAHLPPEALAEANEEPKPLLQDAVPPVPIVPLDGGFQPLPPIVIPDDEPKSVVPEAPKVDAAVDLAGFQIKNADRPMPYCEEECEIELPCRPMPHAGEEEQDVDAMANWLSEWINEAWGAVSIEFPLEEPAKPILADPQMQCPYGHGCYGESGCPRCPKTLPQSTTPDQIDEECDDSATTEPRKSKKAARILQAPLKRSLQQELHPRHPDIDTMEFGPRDWSLNELGSGPLF
jgi:hypothetical protein